MRVWKLRGSEVSGTVAGRGGRAWGIVLIALIGVMGLLGVPAIAVPVGSHGRLRPGVQILAPRFREDLCLDAGEVVEAAEGVVMPIDPVQ